MSTTEEIKVVPTEKAEEATTMGAASDVGGGGGTDADEEVAEGISTLKLTPVPIEECVMGWIKSGGVGARALLPDTKKWIIEWVGYEDKEEVKNISMFRWPVAFFVRRCLTAVYAAQGGRHIEALRIMNGLLNLADQELRASAGVNDSYVEGTLHVLRTHRREIQRQFGIGDGPARCKLARNVKSLDELTDPERAVVYSHKAVFFRYVGAKGEFVESLIQKAIRLDEVPRAEFLHILAGILRSRRHLSEVRYRDAPNEKEVEALGSAFKLGEDKYLLEDVKVSIAKALFDTLKQRNFTKAEIGPYVFNSRDELKEKLKLMALEIGENQNASIRALLAAAFIIGDRRLGYDETRDLIKAREFLDRALALWPSNAKTLTRLGKFYLYEEKNLEKAQEHFKAAMESDASDSLAALSYFWVEGRSSETDAVKDFCPRINEILTSPSAKNWASHVLLDFAVLKGVAYIRSKALKAGLREWGRAQVLSNPYFMIKMFSLNSALRNNKWEMIKRAKKEDCEDEWEDIVRPMGGGDVERILRKYFAKEQEDDTLKELADTLKNISLARRRPGDGDAEVQDGKIEPSNTFKEGVVWKGSLGAPNSDADKDNNWRQRKTGEGFKKRDDKSEGEEKGSWRRKNNCERKANADTNEDQQKNKSLGDQSSEATNGQAADDDEW